MTINWSIDLGTLIQIAGFLGTIIYIAATVRLDTKNVKGDIGDIKVELRSLREVVTTQAAQTVRLDMLSKRIDKLDDDMRLLRSGEGFIFPLTGHRGPFGSNIP